MRKFTRLLGRLAPAALLAAALVLAGCSNPFGGDDRTAEASARTASGDAITIYFQSSSQPTIWMWEAGGDAIFELEGYSWPGPQMSDAGDGWWSYTIPESYYPLELDLNFIFNGNGERVETTLSGPVEASAWYDGEWEMETPEPDPEPEPGDDIRILYAADSQPTIWMWETDGDAIFELEGYSWPGPQMSDAGDGWWSYTIPGEYYPLEGDLSFIFNGTGDRVETRLDGPVDRSARFDGSWELIGPDPEPEPEPEPGEGIRVYTEGYSHIYFWSVVPEIEIVSWPGVALQDHSSGWMYYDFPDADSANLIFSNNGGGQTADLSRESGEWWYRDGDWYDSDPDGPDDPAAPEISVSPAGGVFGDADSVTVQIEATAHEDAPVTSLQYRVDGGSWNSLSGTGVGLQLPQDGSVSLEVRADNSVGSTTAGPFLYRRGTQTESDFSWDNVTVYFAMTDRFLDGDPSNNNSYGRPSVDATGSSIGTFHGGDIIGMTQKLDEGYFEDLGITAIWITAPYEQVHGFVGGGNDGDFAHYGYHGYYALDYTMMDRNIGTVEEMRSFVDTAHEQGIRVILDVVMNHPGYPTLADGARYGFGTHMSLSEAHSWSPSGGQNWFSYNDDGSMDYTNSAMWDGYWGSDWVRAGLPGYQEGGGDDLTMNLAYLPDFKTETTHSVGLPPLLQTKWAMESGGEYDPWRLPAADGLRQDIGVAPADYIVKWLAAWVEEFGIDGFRADTVKHVEPFRWAQLKQAANDALWTWRANNPNAPGADWTDDFWMTAEVWGHGVGRSHWFDYGFDSVINFTFQGQHGGGPAENHPTQMENTYAGYAAAINSDPGFNALSYISQHDTHLHDRHNLINGGTNLLLAPGGVKVFYGDETARPFGETGSDNDQGTRSFMNWGAENDQVLAHFQRLGQFRRRNVAVGAGQHQQISGHSNGYAFSRQTADNRVVVVTGASGSVTVNVSGIWSDGIAVRNAYDDSTATVSGGSVTFNAGSNGVILIEEQ
ncbi:starch-binding protein [Spirochaeta africana]|uniref:Glycosidase n=1 Tax=Spirochaeta africana (strain ATCC 700263 / DSM 8902 / Z-7692) TaxID=889378 RepID=H9UM08_SPIAZ|nr:starch-binding protein [Spirochaeta africana]AFG38551.1 glycosidase [Spirochaeta africana DSM 8902]